MKIPSPLLDAFQAVAHKGSFSAAAKSLHISQSALSRRILNLERELEADLFIRDAGGARLTSVGDMLVRYCQTKDGLEEELFESIRGRREGAHGGVLRVAGFSTVIRPVIMPALSEFIAGQPKVRVEVSIQEIRELPDLLRRGEVDFAVTYDRIERRGVVSQRLGYEENVMVTSAKVRGRYDIFLDHDIEDQTTHQFLTLQGQPYQGIERSFLGDIYGLIDGVRHGWGRAVIPRYMVEDDPDLMIMEEFEPLLLPVHLCYNQQPYVTRLFQAALDALCANAPAYLPTSSPVPVAGASRGQTG